MPLIGITVDLNDRYHASTAAVSTVARAGGIPVLLPCRPELAECYLDRCDGVILSGGDDPIMEHWGVASHPSATLINPRRQAFELAMLEALDERPAVPVLGICLGMQLMGLFSGGRLDQHLPETLSTAAEHYPRNTHDIQGEAGIGPVHSHHRQALADAGWLRPVAWARDGVIEAIRDDARPFYPGVQGHPERTEDEDLGVGLIGRFVEAAKRR